MIQLSIKTEKVLLYLLLVFVVFNTLKQCSHKIQPETPKVTVVRDTIWQTRVDTFKVQTLRYKTVYVNNEDIADIIEMPSETRTPEQYSEAREYKDTLSNEDIDIYSYNLLKGELLQSELSYKLKVPREITVTKTIEYPKTYRSGLYLFSEVGGNTNTFDNLSLGLQYNRKGQWFVSYRINMNELSQPTHHLGVGIRVFK